MKKILKILILIIVIIIILKIWVIDLTKIEGMSMYPTLETNQITLIYKWEKTLKQEMKRGDIVVFKVPDKIYINEEEYNSNNKIAEYKKNDVFKKQIVKRIIGLPGEHIQITDEGKVYLNEKELAEEYLLEPYTGISGKNGLYMFIDIIVPENSVYVLGDNRSGSIDSRSFGCIPLNQIIGEIRTK